jgi:peptidoglycan/xylan/chitin deacetylase (PgdA/CDA1 family)
MNHENGRKTRTGSYLESIDEADKLISSTFFRPPYGSMTAKQAKDVTEAGYKIIMWSLLTYDFDDEVAIDEIIRSAQNVRSGDIVVLHDNPKCVERLKMILPKIMDSMIQKGFALKPIE